MHGTMSEFQPGGKESWSTYTERLGHYFVANKVTEAEQKRAILLSVCGPTTFKLIKSLADPSKFPTMTFVELCALVKEYYEPLPSPIVQRYKFNTRNRVPGETVAGYVAALREIAEYCNYGTSLSEMLRDRLVCGVNHDGIQKKLLAEKELDFDKAYSVAVAIEVAERDTKNLKAERSHGNPVLYSHNKERGKSSMKMSPSKNKGEIICYRCGGNHLANVCRHKDTECGFCRKKGHLARVCRAKRRAQETSMQSQNTRKNMFVTEELKRDETDRTYEMFTLEDQSNEPTRMQVLLNDVPVDMVLDTGASLSIISQMTFNRLKQHDATLTLHPSSTQLLTYTGEPIPVVGVTSMTAQYGEKVATLSAQVVAGEGPDLMGRDWLGRLNVNIGQVNLLEHDKIKEVLDKHEAVFDGSIGCLKDVQVTLQVNETAKPKFLKPRTVPYLLREKVEKQLSTMEQQGIISPVQHSQWAAPIVPIPKSDGTVRICGDFKTTINQASVTETYPLPRVDDLFADLSGGRLFTKLDMSNAYLQLPLSDESKQYVTINTHKGLFQFNRLPFGVCSAPAIFQRTMETLLRGLSGVSVYQDDVLVTGGSTDQHLQNLDEVLSCIENAGLRLNRAKCSFLKPRIVYLGHVIDENGLHPTDDKIDALKQAPTPKNVTQLHSFLGLINYYSKFLPNLSTKLRPLYNLLLKNKRWTWTEQHDIAFKLAKETLQADSVLAHYDSTKPLLLACDASEYGVGAVLSHILDTGEEKPIAYASRTLNSTERHYSQLEREGLAIVFGVKKFHNYLYGRHFTIESDHQPLSHLFSETKSIPAMASARIQRWALTLAAYQYNIRYKSGKTLNNADALSRLPCPITTNSDRVPDELAQLVLHLSSTSINASVIKSWTAKDPVLSRVLRYIQTGWPDQITDKKFKPFFFRKTELSAWDGCILWGSRMVIPPQGRELVLQELHETHPGCAKMKSLARNYIWWPKMDSAIEDTVKQCQACQESRPSPPAAPLHPWEWPSEPWSRIHLDFAGPYMGSMFLVLVNAHSKWMDVHLMQSITSAKTIEKLRIIFANHGIPRKVVTDNGPTFTSYEFQEFMQKNGIVHVKSAPYHPLSNGLAERAVQTLKRGIARISGTTLQERVSKFLFKYRLTPHSVTGVAPSELLFGRRIRCRLDSWFPDTSQRVESQQQKQKQAHDSTVPLRSFHVGDTVYAENFTGSPPKWLQGTVVKVTGPLSYHVELESGHTVRRHVDSLRVRHEMVQQNNSDNIDPLYLPDTTTSPVRQSVPPNPTPRRSSRPRRPVERYGHGL